MQISFFECGSFAGRIGPVHFSGRARSLSLQGGYKKGDLCQKGGESSCDRVRGEFLPFQVFLSGHQRRPGKRLDFHGRLTDRAFKDRSGS